MRLPHGWRLLTTPELTRFLHAADLDDAQSAAAELSDPSRSDLREIRGVLDAWGDDQPLANLLLFPDLMPPDARGEALTKGLSQPARSYLALAAVVGIQKEPFSIPEHDRPAVMERLNELAMQGTPATARRASRTMYELAGPEDAPRIGVLLMHPDPTVKHNVVATLVKLLGVEGTRRTVEKLLEQRLIFLEEERFVDNMLREVKSAEGSEPLLSYIPNLTEFEAG